MADERLPYLFDRYRSKLCSPGELQEFSLLCLLPENQAILEKLAETIWEQVPLDVDMPADTGELILRRILDASFQEPAPETARVRKPWWRVAAAASILLVIGFGTYFLLFDRAKKTTETVQAKVPADVPAPTTNRATITLANGRTIFLDSVANGQLAVQANVKLVKLANGQIAYQTAEEEIIKETQYNTLSNPRGSKVIDMQLADGSHVWLNAGSSVTYPVAFVGNTRKISITGEAYFEVTHDAMKPFYVSKGNMQVQVLGTHFNVNAYDDEAGSRVTLLEGSVEVSNNGNTQRLAPGEQAQVDAGGKITLNRNTDIEQVMAWKNGLFAFDRADLKTVMKELARWYNVEVEYEGAAPDMQFGGKLQRNLSLAQVLRALDKSLVHFRIEGNRIIILE